MNFFISCLVVFDALTDIVLLKKMKSKFESKLTSDESIQILEKTPEFLRSQELIPENGVEIYHNSLKEVLDENVGLLKYNYIRTLEGKKRCNECDIYEFVYEFNTKMTNFFNSIEESLGPSEHIKKHRRDWFDYEKQIPAHLKSSEIELIVNQFK